MRRFYRLLSPAIAFAAVGALLLALAAFEKLGFRGGLTVAGVYALALQCGLAAFLVTAIDDLLERRLVSGDSHGWLGGMLTAADAGDNMRRALLRFYVRPMGPAFLLSFGLAASVSTIAFGALDQPSLARSLQIGSLTVRLSEFTSALIVVVVGALTWRTGGYGYFGWVAGLCLGSALAQISLDPVVIPSTTLVSWLGLACGLVCAGLVRMAWRRKRALGR